MVDAAGNVVPLSGIEMYLGLFRPKDNFQWSVSNQLLAGQAFADTETGSPPFIWPCANRAPTTSGRCPMNFPSSARTDRNRISSAGHSTCIEEVSTFRCQRWPSSLRVSGGTNSGPPTHAQHYGLIFRDQTRLGRRRKIWHEHFTGSRSTGTIRRLVFLKPDVAIADVEVEARERMCCSVPYAPRYAEEIWTGGSRRPKASGRTEPRTRAKAGSRSPTLQA